MSDTTQNQNAGDMDAQVLAMLEQYDNNSKRGSSNNKFNLNNYFTTHLEDGIQTGEKKIRILPALEGDNTPFAVMHGHNYKVDGKWKKFPCLKHNEENDDCPFCEARAVLLKTGKETDKEKAKQYSPRKFYVCRVIDRENESEGVKFWRFSENFKKEGTYDKIFSIYRSLKRDIAHPETGMDLTVSLARNDKGFPTVQAVIPMGESVITEDADKKATWLGDTRTWRDVYSVRTYEYLEIVVRGGNPFYDKENSKWVDKNTMEEQPATNNASGLDAELSMGGNNANDALIAEEAAPKTTEVPVTEAAPVEAPTTTTDNISDDDLPF